MRNEEKVKKLGKENIRYYHARDNPLLSIHKLKAATVCVIKAEGFFMRGVSCCSASDNFCKKTGRQVALGRAIQALESKETKKLETLGLAVSVFNATLTPFEQGLFKERENQLPQKEVEDLRTIALTPQWVKGECPHG